MAINSDSIKELKGAVRSMSKKNEKGLRKADVVSLLIKDIHEKMEAGFSLGDILEEINKKLPEGEKFKETTFKTYVRNARESAGIKPIRTWKRRAQQGATSVAAGVVAAKNDSQVHVNNNPPEAKTEDGFRDIGGAV